LTSVPHGGEWSVHCHAAGINAYGRKGTTSSVLVAGSSKVLEIMDGFVHNTFGNTFLRLISYFGLGKCWGIQGKGCSKCVFTDWLGMLYTHIYIYIDRLCGLVIKVLGYRSGGPGSILGTTRKKISGSGTVSTQPR
jgi:hypothetical protein